MNNSEFSQTVQNLQQPTADLYPTISPVLNIPDAQISKVTLFHYSKAYYITLIWLFIVVSILLFLLTPKGFIYSLRVYLSRYILHTAYVLVKSQPITSPFIIQGARLQRPGFIVLFFGDYYDSPYAEKIETSRFLPAGEYFSSIQIEFELEQYEKTIKAGRLSDVDFTKQGHPVFVIVYYDDGDSKFSITSDSIAKDSFGAPMISKVLLQ